MGFSQRLRRIRLSRGLTQDALVYRMGGLITKQALSQFETGKTQPRLTTLLALAEALSVATADLLADSTFSVELVAYRRRASMPKGFEEKIFNEVSLELEKRVRLYELINPRIKKTFPLFSFHTQSLADAENAAMELRELIGLGNAPIGSVTDTFASHGIHVFPLDTSEKFEGVSAIVKKEKTIVGAGIATRLGVCGERQRLTMCHEVGHLYLEVSPGVDEEKMAFRFAGAFLMPSKAVFAEVGVSRRAVYMAELLTLKKRYGVSIAAILTRLRDLDIITPDYYRSCFINLSKRGWRIQEPEPLEPEESLWLNQNVLRARAQGLLTAQEAAEMLGRSTPPIQAIQLALFDDEVLKPTSNRHKSTQPTLFDYL